MTGAPGEASREKQWVAAASVAAAVMTWFAVRLSDRPPDSDHLYGHGKVENISALFETFLLLLTCIWIIDEAFRRLVSGNAVVEITVWSFVVMTVSIVIDYSRSRVLYRAARKHNSQALEADALHFSTDIWSSVVVLIGLTSVLLSRRFPQLAALHAADSIAAILVAVICLCVIYRLGMRAVQALLDAAPAGTEQAIIAAAEAVPGVVNCHSVRVRAAGPQLFVDAHVLVDGGQTLQQAHDLTEVIESAIRQVAPNADVTVHPEPR